MQVDEERNGWDLPAIEMEARTVVGRGGKSLLNPFRAPKSFPTLTSSKRVPKKGFQL